MTFSIYSIQESEGHTLARDKIRTEGIVLIIITNTLNKMKAVSLHFRADCWYINFRNIKH